MSDDGATFQIVQVNLQADRGGDGRIVSSLHKAYAERGYDATLLVGRGSVSRDGEHLIPNDAYRSAWAKSWASISSAVPQGAPPRRSLSKVVRWIAQPRRMLRIHEGFEDFDFPATLPVIARAVSGRRTILHLHNLHGGYFDLRALPHLNRLAPTVLTLHDEWTFTGHCAYTFSSDGWRIGCGNCPDLESYPGIPKDRTAENFALKARIFAQTRLNVTSPSNWLMERARVSLLGPAIEDARVIPNGIDNTTFRPANVAEDRSQLQLPPTSKILLCAGSAARTTRRTRQEFLRRAAAHLGSMGIDTTMVFIGSREASSEDLNGLRVLHRPFERAPSRMASYYRAADAYLHAALADNLPMAIIESLACGTPVIATDVGGIPEEVTSLWSTKRTGGSPAESATGILLDPDDDAGVTAAIDLLFRDDRLRSRLSTNGSKVAAAKFSFTRQVSQNLEWYREILSRPRRPTSDLAQLRKDRR